MASGLVMREDLVDLVVGDRVPGELGDEVGAPALLGVRGPGGVAGGGVPSGLLGCGWPLETMGAASGSQTTILVSGRFSARTRATPLSVPPVPKPVTQ